MNRVKNCVFLVRKWSYTTFNTVNIRKMWEKKEKIRRTRSMTKKKSSEIFTLKMEIFPEIGPRKNFVVPPNSAPGLRPWAAVKIQRVRQADSQTAIVDSAWSLDDEGGMGMTMNKDRLCQRPVLLVWSERAAGRF